MNLIEMLPEFWQESEEVVDMQNAFSISVNNADKALYHIKRSTKNGYAVWDEVCHILENK